MTKKPFRIDIHHHMLPDILMNALEEASVTKSGGVPMKRWAPQDSLTMMDRLQIKTAIFDISEPGVSPLVKTCPAKAKALARRVNGYMAELHVKYPARFGGFAVLPLPNLDDSLEELAYALDVLKLDGVGLLSNYGPVFLGDPELDPLFAEINRRKAAAFIHPSTPGVDSWRPKFLHIDSPLEFMFCTTRAAANLIFSGSLERYRDMNIILAHAGGTLPYLKFRLDEFYVKYTPLKEVFSQDFIRKGWESLTQKPSEYMANFWYDDCTSTSHIVFEAVKDICGYYRMMFGSDMCFNSPLIRDDMVKILESYAFTKEEKANVERNFAAKLFPRFK
jgi:predicted TIM-barrel fold metal-dependent hydrolase